ncbi:MAG: glucuronate isomerase [Ruminococcaceae bacterium]|nr:glucuronate isomerase [Oscillospiraceae bacterium]
MKPFMDKDFLLQTETAKALYHNHAKKMPIIDYHCHLSPQEIAEDKKYENITQVWLYGDHYKWRAMRSAGIEERFITGDATDREKFDAWAKVMPQCIGNPLYHWTHLELQRFFGITEPLCPATADKIWCETEEKLKTMSARSLIAMSNVEALCTTDDPADDLHYHEQITADPTLTTKVYPTFRPDKAAYIGAPGFADYIATLGKAVGTEITDIATLEQVLLTRIDYFAAHGCRLSDHAFATVPFVSFTKAQADTALRARLGGMTLTTEQEEGYQTYLMQVMARKFHELGWTMQLHIGPMRNNNTAMFQRLGPDLGFDSIYDGNIAQGLSRFLDSLALDDCLPKTVLYNLNPAFNYVIGTMCGNFQNADAPGKIQFGSAWWFCDHKDGMEEQMRTLANLGVLARFVGMLTDSRSFLSYPRHEYFRRILCNLIGNWVENGEYPADMETLGRMVEDISYYNAKNYLKL